MSMRTKSVSGDSLSPVAVLLILAQSQVDYSRTSFLRVLVSVSPALGRLQSLGQSATVCAQRVPENDRRHGDAHAACAPSWTTYLAGLCVFSSRFFWIRVLTDDQAVYLLPRSGCTHTHTHTQ